MTGDSNPTGVGLIDVLDRVLDKGIVIDAAVRVSLVGVELLGVDARVVVASIQTYLLHADALAYTTMVAYPQPQQRTEPPLVIEPLAEPGQIAGPRSEPLPEPAHDSAETDAGTAGPPDADGISAGPPATGP